MSHKGKIAVFDSGLGGISVLRELVRLMPEEDFLYYGDSANAPYGVRTADEIRELCSQVIRQILSEEPSVKCVVIACNTATSAAIEYLQKEFPQLMFIGIEPAVEWAVNSLDHPTVLTLATDFTVHGERFLKNLEHLSGKGSFISMGAPGFVTFVESGVSDSKPSEECTAYIDSLCEKVGQPVDAIVLGCTHFPFLKEMIRKEAAKQLGCDPQIFDAAVLVAQNTKDWLQSRDLLETEGTGSVVMENSDPSRIDLMWKLYES